MIQKHKCDVCRQRKIKCDEVKPACSTCRKKGRPCSYNDRSYIQPGTSAPRIKKAQTSRDGLALIAEHDAQDGALFQTWVLRPASAQPRAPSQLLSNTSTQLRSQWINMLAMISSRSSPTAVYDHFLATIPMRIGSHVAVDAAAMYNLECFKSYAMEDTSPTYAEPLGSKAVSVLRRTVSSCSENDEDLIMSSIMLLITAEYLKGSRRALHMHTKAICDILKARSNAGRWTDIDDALLKAIFQEDVERAIRFGHCALLDDEHILTRLQAAHDHEASLIHARLWGLIAQMIKVPRLLTLVRDCVDMVPDESQKRQILDLAHSLYDFRVTPSSAKAIHETPPRYYSYRLTICGIIHRMRDLSIASDTDFDFNMIEAEEDEVATLFANDLQGYFDPFKSAPWKATRFAALVTAAYGAWSGAETRHRNGASSGRSEEAVRKMQQCVELHAQALNAVPGWDTKMLWRQITKMVTGGPLMPPSFFSRMPVRPRTEGTIAYLEDTQQTGS